MSKYQNIFWRSDMDDSNTEKGKMFANIHLLIGYNQRSIEAYKKMAAELRETFPDVTDSEVICGIVTESIYCKNLSIITVNKVIDIKEYPGWRQHKDDKPDYHWR